MKTFIFYNSKLAKAILLKAYETMMFFGTIITKAASLSKQSINHEMIHVCQYLEVTAAAAIILGIVSIFTSAWVLIIAPFIYYLIYGIECLISYTYHWIRGDSTINDKVYYACAFEIEAHKYEADMSYIDNRKLFSFIKYYGKI